MSKENVLAPFSGRLKMKAFLAIAPLKLEHVEQPMLVSGANEVLDKNQSGWYLQV